jgi:hypothetical protein
MELALARKVRTKRAFDTNSIHSGGEEAAVEDP